MRRSVISLTVLGTIVVSLAGVTRATEPSPALFDSPAKVVRIPLPNESENPQAKLEIACFYYPRFMIKQMDDSYKRATISTIPASAENQLPPCRQESAGGETMISVRDWWGYFKGIKGGYLFLEGDDGWNGGMAFAIFGAADGNKVFDDGAEKFESIELTSSGISMRYVRVYLAPCSLRADESGCWPQVQLETGLQGPAPGCAAAYERAAEPLKQWPERARERIADPSVIDYEAETVIEGDDVKITPISGRALGCRPAD